MKMPIAYLDVAARYVELAPHTILKTPTVANLGSPVGLYLEQPWVGLSDSQIENIYNEVVKIHRGAAMPYGQVVFGRAVQAKLRELNAPQIDPNQWAFDNGLEST
jgi:hypothetical protein